MTDLTPSRFRLFGSMRRTSKVPTSPPGSDKPLPSPPVARISLHDESRPLSPSVSSFSRRSGVPVRAHGASRPFSRASSLLSTSPSSPEGYVVTDEEFVGLKRVDHMSREVVGVRSPRFGKPKLVDIPPSRKRKFRNGPPPKLPPPAGPHAVPLATIVSQTTLPVSDFDVLHPQSSLKQSSSVLTAAPSSPPRSLLPRRIHSRIPSTWESSDGAPFHSSQYGKGHGFENFPGVVDQPDINEAETDIDDSFEENDITDMGKSLTRYDSPMQFGKDTAANDAVAGAYSRVEDDTDEFPEQKTAATVHTSMYSAPRFEDLADRIEAMPHTVQDPSPLASSPPPTIDLPQPQRSTGHSRYGGLAGVNTPGKMRAARVAMSQSEPNFARTTASVAAKSTAPPDIRRVKSPFDLPTKLRYPTKKRSMIEKLSDLFHKGAKKEKESGSPATTRLRIGRDATNNKLKVKRESEATVLGNFHSPTLSPAPKVSERKSSPLKSFMRSKIPSPTFGKRGISPVSETVAPQAPPSSPLPERASVERAGSTVPFIPVDGSLDSTLEFCSRLANQAANEPDSHRQRKLLALVESLHFSMECVRQASLLAEEARQASRMAMGFWKKSKRPLMTMQKMAAKKLGQKDDVASE